MNIRDFLADRNQVLSWLASEAASMDAKGIYMKYWLHPTDAVGFGLVIVDGNNSGELHLLPDGTVTSHVEHGVNVVLDKAVMVREHGNFLELFGDFTKLVAGFTV